MGLFYITNFALMILGVLAFFTIIDGYGGLNNMNVKKKEAFAGDYYNRGGKSNRRYSNNYLLLPTSQLSQQEKQCVNNRKGEHPCSDTDKYSHICHAMYGKKRTSS